MKTQMSTKAGYFGAGVGLVLFFLVGLMPVSLVGGEYGMAFAGMLSGLQQNSGYVARAIVLACMITAVLVSGIAVVAATSALTWVMGSMIDPGMQKRQDKMG